MISVENLTFAYKRGKKEVLHDFSLTLEQGKVYGLLGENGAGKSTLLYLMAGLLTPQHGCVRFNGVNVRRRLPSVLGNTYFVPDEYELPAVRMEEFVRLNSPFYPKFSRADFDSYLCMFDMEKTGLNLGELSLGQKKKVMMAFALAANTALLLMDEPTNGLDIPSKSQFRKFIAAGMSDERTVIISTHQVRDIDQLLDHVIVMDNSHVLLNASVNDIIKRLYFGETDDAEVVRTAIAALPSYGGTKVMLPNRDGADSQLNLELLFNGTLAHQEIINTLFHTEKTNEP